MSTGAGARSPERQTVADFLDSVATGPAALVLEGEAGIGKTTLWSEAVTSCAEKGIRVLCARVGQAESVLAYAAVADLLTDVDAGVIESLPALQRLAMDRVLLRADGEGPATDQRVTAAAFGVIVEELAERSPVVIAIDDVQWLDASSKSVIAFVARRLRGPIGILATERCDPDQGTTSSWLQLGVAAATARTRLRPLSLGGLHGLILTRLGHALPRATMVRISEISGGNPFYALELARALDGQNLSPEPGLPQTLAELVRARIGRLDGDVRNLLLAVASVAAPTVDLLARVNTTTADHIVELLETVETDEIITINGNQVRFTHPLLARGVYSDATPASRRVIHRALAAVETQPELKARHLALAGTSADDATLGALDSAADAARQRGAPAAAAELLELAIQLGGDKPLRRVRAAGDHFRAGDTARAQALLDACLGDLRPGWLRAIALNLRAAVHIYDNRFTEAIALLNRAAEDARDTPPILVQTLMSLSLARGMGSHSDGADPAGWVEEMVGTARRAVTLAEELGDPSMTSQALTMWVHTRFIHGYGVDEDSLARAVALECVDDDVPTAFSAGVIQAMVSAWTGDLAVARRQLLAVRQRCLQRGDDRNMMGVAAYHALIDMWSGNLGEATSSAQEAVERAQQLGGSHVEVIPLTVRAAVAAYQGHESAARADCGAVMQAVAESGAARMADWPRMTLGFLEVSRGDYAEAASALQPLVDRLPQVPGIELMHGWFLPDAAEAMVALGRLDDAEDVITLLETHGRRLDRAWMLATGARCRAMLLAAYGSLDEALAKTEEAMAEHERLPMPFERHRSLLLLGQLQRRRRAKDAAGRTLREALEAFEALGATLWAQRVRAELARTNAGRNAESPLTPSEQRVAELAASGLRNRDIAAQLFISLKTVEHNLSRVYSKLGIRTRAELGRRLDRMR